MKKVLSILCAVFFAAASYAAIQDTATRDSVKTDAGAVETDTVKVVEVHEGPMLDFGNKTEVDFGQIKERGGKQVREFTFENSGNKPLVITRTTVSCKCMDVAFSKKPVMPGGKGTITVTYNPRKQSGIFLKAIQVYSNDPQTRRIIFAKGEVVE